MALVIHYSVDETTVEEWGTPREGKVAGIVTKADQGVPGSSNQGLPDPGGAHVVRGLRRTYWEETDSPVDNRLLYDGYLTQRDYTRDAEHILGSHRLIAVNMVDLNNLLSTQIIHGPKDAAHGFRPDETDLERIAWLLDGAYIGPINDFGLVSTTGAVDMDGADLRGQNAGNILRDAGLLSGKDWWLYYDETQPTVNRIGLFYDFTEAPVFSSTLRLSNHPGDADGDITFEVDSEQPPVMHRDPSQIITGAQVDYDGGSVFVDSDDLGLTTRTDYYVREVVLPSINTKKVATAIRLAERALRDHNREEDTASVRVLLPSTHVGLIKAGHRIEARFDHFEPEYRDFTWWRIKELTWAQRGRKWYWVNLEMTPGPPTDSFLVAFQANGFDDQPEDLSVVPWTSLEWTGDFTLHSVIACGAGPPSSEGGGVYARLISGGESAVVGEFKLDANSTGGTHVFQLAGIDISSVMGDLVSASSAVFVPDGGDATISAVAATESVLIGMFLGGKVNYDDGWCASSSSGWGGDLMSTVLGTQIVSASSYNGCGGQTPWVWIGYVTGTGTLTLRVNLNSNGGGSGAYTCGYNVGLVSLLIPLTGAFSVGQHGFGFADVPGDSYTVSLPGAP